MSAIPERAIAFSELAVKRIESALLSAIEDAGFSADDWEADELRMLVLVAIEAVAAECELQKGPPW